MKPSKNKYQMPSYVDGIFDLYEIIETNEVASELKLKNTNKKMTFKELSISDKLRSDLNSHDVDISLKIRIPYSKGIISSNNVLKIDGKFYKVYNAYHFENNQGFRETDLTLTNWSDG